MISHSVLYQMLLINVIKQVSCTITQVHVKLGASICTSEPSPHCDELDPRRQRHEQWGWRRRRVCPWCSGSTKSSPRFQRACLCWRWAEIPEGIKMRNEKPLWRHEPTQTCEAVKDESDTSSDLTSSWCFPPVAPTHLLMSLCSVWIAGFTLLANSEQPWNSESFSTSEL